MSSSMVYKTIAFTTAFFCLLSFAHAENLASLNVEEVAHYSGDGNLICFRTHSDDRSDIPSSEIVIADPRFLLLVAAQDLTPAYQQSTTHHEIRGPPAIVSLR